MENLDIRIYPPNRKQLSDNVKEECGDLHKNKAGKMIEMIGAWWHEKFMYCALLNQEEDVWNMPSNHFS